MSAKRFLVVLSATAAMLLVNVGLVMGATSAQTVYEQTPGVVAGVPEIPTVLPPSTTTIPTPPAVAPETTPPLRPAVSPPGPGPAVIPVQATAEDGGSTLPVTGFDALLLFGAAGIAGLAGLALRKVASR